MAVRRTQPSAHIKKHPTTGTGKALNGFSLSQLGITLELSKEVSTKTTPSLFESIAGYPLRYVGIDIVRTFFIFGLVCIGIGAVSLFPLI